MRDGNAAGDDDAAVPTLHLKLLGGFRATRDGGAPVVQKWRRPSAQVIVKMLAVADGHRLHRDVVIDACWPDADPAAALRNLRVALHAARHALQPDLPRRTSSAYVTGHGELLLLEPGHVAVDIDEVAAAAEEALADGGADRLAAAHDALAPEVLPEDRYADWAAVARDRMAALRDRVALALAAMQVSSGHPEDAVGPLRAVLGRAPADEAAHRELMRSYLAAGRRRQAIRQYHECVRVLRDELGIRPDPETDALYRAALVATAVRPASSASHLPAVLRRRAPATPLVGRTRALAAVAASDARVVIVSGEAGIGKTRLVTAVARAAWEAGGRVLWGAARDADTTPYGPMAEALDGYLAGVDASTRADVAGEYPELVALLPALGPALLGVGAAADRAQLYQGIVGLLDDLADRPTLVVVEDIHAADQGTVRLLFQLSRAAAQRPWQVVATVREEDLEPADERRRLLDAVVRQGLAHRVELMRLGRDDCDRLVDAVVEDPTLSGRAREQLWELSRGNPLFVTELAGILRSGSVTSGESLETGLAPGALTDVVRGLVGRRADAVEPRVRAVADIVAVAGGGAAAVEIADVAAHGVHPPLSAAETAEALDAAVTLSLVEERDVVVGHRSEPGYEFRHPLVRLAWYERLGSARRRMLHAAFGAAVGRRRPDSIDALAHHLSLAGDPTAVDHLRSAAARAAALYANDAADAYYRDLFERLVGTVHSGGELDLDVAGLRVEHAVVLRRLARYDDAETTLNLAMEAFRRAGDDDAAVRAAAMLAEVLGRAGRPADGVAVLDSVDPGRDGVGVVNAAEHTLAVGVLAFSTGRYDDGLVATETAEGLARRARAGGHRATLVLARALANRAACLVMLGRNAEAVTVAEQALPYAETSGDVGLLSRVLSELGELARGAGRLDDARQYAVRALGEAERHGDPTAISFERGNLARLYVLHGEVAAARSLVAGAVDLARPFGNSWALAYALVNRAEVHVAAGELRPAQRCLAETAALAESSGDRQVLTGVRTLRAEIALVEGRPGDVESALAGESAGPADPLRVRAFIALGAADDARILAEEIVARCSDTGDRLTEAEVRYHLGAAAAAVGDMSRARREWSTVAATARAMPHPTLAARADAALAGVRRSGSARGAR